MIESVTISVGIPTYRRAKYLIRAIESVRAQTYSKLEIIVSDNASGDETAASVRAIADPRVIFIEQPTNLGMIENFNACLNASTGDLFIMLSDDDLMEPTCLERLSEPFRTAGKTGKDIGVVWCPVKILNARGEMTYVTGAGPKEEPGWALVEGLFLGTRGPRFCSVLVRRADAVAAGGYRLEHGPICDVGNWTHIALSHELAVCVPEPLSGYTVHAASITSQPDGGLWQRSGETINVQLVALLKERGDLKSTARVAAAGKANVSNLIATVMLQQLGKPGWQKYWISEVFRAPRYLLSRVVLKRALLEGWKLFRLSSRR